VTNSDDPGTDCFAPYRPFERSLKWVFSKSAQEQ
jgi:hypothetical protein